MNDRPMNKDLFETIVNIRNNLMDERYLAPNERIEKAMDGLNEIIVEELRKQSERALRFCNELMYVWEPEEGESNKKEQDDIKN